MFHKMYKVNEIDTLVEFFKMADFLYNSINVTSV